MSYVDEGLAEVRATSRVSVLNVLSNRMLELLWREFSDQEYSAGFLTPRIETIERFDNWVVDYLFKDPPT